MNMLPHIKPGVNFERPAIHVYTPNTKFVGESETTLKGILASGPAFPSPFSLKPRLDPNYLTETVFRITASQISHSVDTPLEQILEMVEAKPGSPYEKYVHASKVSRGVYDQFLTANTFILNAQVGDYVKLKLGGR